MSFTVKVKARMANARDLVARISHAKKQLNVNDRFIILNIRRVE
jgi:hypothetical protein